MLSPPSRPGLRMLPAPAARESEGHGSSLFRLDNGHLSSLDLDIGCSGACTFAATIRQPEQGNQRRRNPGIRGVTAGHRRTAAVTFENEYSGKTK